MSRFLALIMAWLMPVFMIVACNQPVSDSGYTNNPQPQEVLDPLVLEQIEQSERLDYWVEQMDPYIVDNDDWTYSFDLESFRIDMINSNPEVESCFGANYVASADCDTITTLLNGLPIVNELILIEYEARQNAEIQTIAVWNRYNWWGYSRCYSGSDASSLAGQMVIGSAVVSLPPIGRIPGAVLAIYAGTAQHYASRYGGFCINVTWAGHVSIGRL